MYGGRREKISGESSSTYPIPVVMKHALQRRLDQGPRKRRPIALKVKENTIISRHENGEDLARG